MKDVGVKLIRILTQSGLFRSHFNFVANLRTKAYLPWAPTPAFPSLIAAVVSVDHTVLWHFFSLNGVPEKYIPLFRPVCAKSRNRVSGSGDISPEHIGRSGTRQDWSPTFSFHLWSYQNSSTDIYPHRKMSESRYVGNFVQLNEKPSNLQASLDPLRDSVNMFRFHFAH